MKKIKKGDPVIVIAGKDKGKVSTIQKIDGERIYVKWVNVAKKAVRGQGFVEKTLSIHISNVAYYHEVKKAPSRIKILIDDKWKKKRVLKKFKDIVID